APASKKIVHTADDLPRYSYPVPGSATALLTSDDATFDAFADKVGADIDRTVAGYQIDDHATLRGLLEVRLQLQMLTGRDAAALRTIDEIRSLEDKPDAKLLTGLQTRAMLRAHADTKAWSGPSYEQ